MKNGMILTVLASMLASGVGPCFAQDANPGVPSAPGQAPRPVDPSQRRERLVRDVRPGEGLTDEQREKVRTATEKVREEQRALSDKLREARRELELAVQEKDYQETKIREKAQAVGKLEGDLAVLRAKQYAELRKILPKEQFERMQQPGNPEGRFRGRGADGRPGAPRQAPQPATRPAAEPTQPK